MKLAICDDEKDIRNYIEKCIREINPESDVIKYSDGREILKPGFDADILFLDIQMPDVDGMRAARILRDTGSKTIIVFVTAVEEFVFQAFDVGAVQYILKPFDKNKLMETIRKAISLAKEQKTITDILAADPSDETDPRYIMVKSDGVNTRIVLKDIAYAEVFDRRVALHMNDRECIEYYGRMTELERVAGDGFFRPHRAYLINLGFVSSYQNIRESREESYARRALESQTEEMHRHMEQIDETYEKMRAMRHDMGNHMAVIQGLIESGDRDAANDYIGEWRENMNNLEMSVKTGNPFTDVAISGFADRFEETGISFDQSFVYPENLHINPFDLCVVLSNALQNAYEASVNVDDPYVSLTSVLKNNTFIINVRNRIGLEIDIDKETGLPYSSKKEDGHGYGLKNIRNVAQKYNGDIDIRQEHDGHGLIFILNVMMIG